MKLIQYFYCEGKQGYYFAGVFEGENLSYDLVYICTTPDGYRVGSQDIEVLRIDQLSPAEIIDSYSNSSTKECKNPLDNSWSKKDILKVLDEGREVPF